MGACGLFLHASVYVFVILVVTLTYFHLECLREEENNAKVPKFDKYNPDVTDVKTKLLFNPKGEVASLDLGPEFILIQSAPCALCKLITFLSGKTSATAEHAKSIEENGTWITIQDARKKSPGPFHEAGFTLIELDQVPDITDWRSNPMQNPDAEVTKFHKIMDPYLMKLYPQTKKILWTHNVVRGGNKLGDQPIALGPHLDYDQDDAARLEFHKERPPMVPRIGNLTEPDVLMGNYDTDEFKLGVLLGVWKPIFPKKVCDHPLAVMDVRTFSKEFLTPLKLSINFLLFTFNNLNGLIAHDPDQKWYYYPFQSEKEVLVFHQYSKGKFFANPHTSFNNRNCPDDTQKRISVEFRVALYF